MSAYWADPERNMPAESNITSPAQSDPQSVQTTTMTLGETFSVLTIRSIDKHQASIAMPSCEMCGRQLVREGQHDHDDNTLFGRTLCRMCMLYRWQIWCEGFDPRNKSSEDEEDCDEEYYSASEDERSDDEKDCDIEYHSAPEEVADY